MVAPQPYVAQPVYTAGVYYDPYWSASALAPSYYGTGYWSGGVWYDYDGLRAVIEWQDVHRYGDAETLLPNTFEIVLYPDGRIVYQYLSMRAAQRASSTIGIQNAARDDGLQIAFDVASAQRALDAVGDLLAAAQGVLHQLAAPTVGEIGQVRRAVPVGNRGHHRLRGVSGGFA